MDNRGLRTVQAIISTYIEDGDSMRDRNDAKMLSRKVKMKARLVLETLDLTIGLTEQDKINALITYDVDADNRFDAGNRRIGCYFIAGNGSKVLVLHSYHIDEPFTYLLLSVTRPSLEFGFPKGFFNVNDRGLDYD